MKGISPLKEALEQQKEIKAMKLERISKMLGSNSTPGQVRTISKNMMDDRKRKQNIPEWSKDEVLHSVRGPNKYQVLSNWAKQRLAGKNLKAEHEKQRELNQLFGMKRKHQREEAIHDYFDRQNRRYDREEAEKEMYKYLTDDQKALYEHRKEQLESQENTPGNFNELRAVKLFMSHIPKFVQEEIKDEILPIEGKSQADSSGEFARGDSDTSIRKRYQTTLGTIQKLEDEGKISDKQRSRILFNLLQSYKKSDMGDKILVKKQLRNVFPYKKLSKVGPLKISGPHSDVIRIRLAKSSDQFYPVLTNEIGKHPKPYDGFVPVKETPARRVFLQEQVGEAAP